jgi:ribosomal protein S18 acetylase RimI-like enzyme
MTAKLVKIRAVDRQDIPSLKVLTSMNEDQLVEFVGAERHRLYVADVGGVVAGCVLFDGTPEDHALVTVRVAEGHRKQGVGSLLFDHARGLMKPARRTKMVAKVRDYDVESCRFYTARKFGREFDRKLFAETDERNPEGIKFTFELPN